MDRIETDIIPFGSVLPFKKDEVEEGWLVFDGSELDKNEQPDLWYHLQLARHPLDYWWNAMGGILDRDRIVLPNVSEEDVADLMRWPSPIPGTTLAIKAIRTPINREIQDAESPKDTENP